MKNQSEYAVHLTKDGVTESFLPGDDLPDWAEKLVTNPLVTGKGSENPDKGRVELDSEDSKPAARRGRPAKESDDKDSDES